MSPQAWPPVPPRVQRGKVTSGAGLVSVTFAQPFDVAPVVVAAPEATATQFAVVLSVTTNGFSVGVILHSTGAFVAGVTAGWIAYPL